MTQPSTISVREAALYLGVSTQRIYQLVEDGKLDNVRANTASNVRINRKQLESRRKSLAASPDLRNGQ